MDIYATHMYVTHVRDKRACAGAHSGAHNGTFCPPIAHAHVKQSKVVLGLG